MDILEAKKYSASRGFSLVFLSVVLPFSSRFWLLAFCFGCFCAEEKTSADSRLGFRISEQMAQVKERGERVGKKGRKRLQTNGIKFFLEIYMKFLSLLKFLVIKFP